MVKFKDILIKLRDGKITYISINPFQVAAVRRESETQSRIYMSNGDSFVCNYNRNRLLRILKDE